MNLTVNLVALDGTVSLQAKALPLHDRIAIPVDLRCTLSSADAERLHAATRRLHRCNLAREAMGDFKLSFSNGTIVADPIPNDIGLKALALEARPFFLNDDPLFFNRLLKLESFSAYPELVAAFRQHANRWRASAFSGVMSINIGGRLLDLDSVVSAWFNSDLFHTGPLKPGKLSLDELDAKLGGARQSRTLLALHLTSALDIANEFLKDVMAVSPEFRAWVTSYLSEQSA